MGWVGLKNGELLRKTQVEFDLFVTTDKNLAFQNNVVQYDIAVIVLRAKSNRLQDLVPLVPAALKIINSIQPGNVVCIPISS